MGSNFVFEIFKILLGDFVVFHEVGDFFLDIGGIFRSVFLLELVEDHSFQLLSLLDGH